MRAARDAVVLGGKLADGRANDVAGRQGGGRPRLHNRFHQPGIVELGAGHGWPARQVVPKLQFQSYDVEDSSATHVQLRVISNQCTGIPPTRTTPTPTPRTIATVLGIG